MKSWVSRPFVCGLLLLVFSACQGPGSTPRVLKLGLVAPFEGYQRDLGYRLLPAVTLAVDDFNRRQVAARSDLRLMVAAMDDSADPAMTARRLQQMAADPDMLALLVGTEPQTAHAALTVLPTSKVPLLLLDATGPAALAGAGWVSLAPPLAARLQTALAYARQALDVSRLVIVGADPEVAAAWQEVAQSQGLMVTVARAVEAPQVQQASALLLAADGADAIFWLQQIRQAGLPQPVLGLGSLDTPKVDLILGTNLGNVFAILPYCPAGSNCWQTGADQQPLPLPAWEQAYQEAAHQPVSGMAGLAYLSAAYVLQHLSPDRANRTALLQALQADPPTTLPPILIHLPAR